MYYKLRYSISSWFVHWKCSWTLELMTARARDLVQLTDRRDLEACSPLSGFSLQLAAALFSQAPFRTEKTLDSQPVNEPESSLSSSSCIRSSLLP